MRRASFIVAVTSLLGALLLGLSACGTTHTGVTPNSEYERYYQGSEGVYMQFLPGSPPPHMYYYGAATTNQDNTFDISVELHNMGASDAYGALFIRGYDPHIIAVEGTDLSITPPGACSIGLGGSGSIGGILGFTISCPSARLAVFNEDNIHADILNIGEMLGIPGIGSLSFDMVGDMWRFDLTTISRDQYDQFNHGRLFSMVLASSTNFQSIYGYPFNEEGIIRGDNYFYPGGEYAFQTFNARIYDWPLGLDYYDVNFIVDACYGYTTYAAPMICIDPQPYEYQKGECIPREYKWSGSQGAPVAITSVKQDQTPRSIMLTFTIRNVGIGEIVHPGYLEWCSPHHMDRFDSRFKDVVYIGDVRIGSQMLQCSPSYEVRLHDGIGTFTCEYFIDTASAAYETPAIVELWYGYHDSIQAMTRIKRAG